MADRQFGMGPFYDGLMHFLMSPEDIVPVVGMALLAGLRGENYGRRALFVLPTAWFLGALAGLNALAATRILSSLRLGLSCLAGSSPPMPMFLCVPVRYSQQYLASTTAI